MGFIGPKARDREVPVKEVPVKEHNCVFAFAEQELGEGNGAVGEYMD